MSCRTEARVERNTARASPFSTCVPRTATATRLLNRVLGVYGYSGFRRESKITRARLTSARYLCRGYQSDQDGEDCDEQRNNTKNVSLGGSATGTVKGCVSVADAYAPAPVL